MIYVVIPIFLANQENEKLNYEKIFRIIIYISLLGAPVLNGLLDLKYIRVQQMNMSYAYSMSISVFASIIHFFFFKKKKDILLILGYVYNIFMLFQILLLGNRGVILCLMSLILLTQVFYASNKSISKKKRRIWIFVIITEVIIGLLVVINLESIINGVYDFALSRMKTVPSILLKMKYLYSIGEGVGNHRDDVYSIAFSYVLSNPLGKGIDSLYWLSNQQVIYAHNFILALLLDCGWLVGGLISIISLYPIYVLIKDRNLIDREVWGFLAFAISISIPKVLVSGNIWLQPHFWFIAGLGYSMWVHKKKYNNIHVFKKAGL